MKDTVLDLSFQDYLERMKPQSSFQEQLVVIDLDDSMTKKDKVGRYPMQLEASSLILVVSGEMQIEVDYLDQNFKNILRRNGFESLEGLRGYPKKLFIKFSNMGQATLQELYQI